MNKEFQSFLAMAKAAEEDGNLDDAEGFFNDAIAAAAARGSVQNSADCHFQLASFFERQGRTQEAANVKKIADVIAKLGER